MGEFIIKLPDVGEGVAEAELVEWNVAIGDIIAEDFIVGAVMTDKATVEIPSPVRGKVLWLGGEIGQKIATGSPLVRLEVDGDTTAASPASAVTAVETVTEKIVADAKTTIGHAPNIALPDRVQPPQNSVVVDDDGQVAVFPQATSSSISAQRPPQSRPASVMVPKREGERPIASPAVRLRAKEAGVDLRQIQGSGPAGRILHEDLDDWFANGALAPSNRQRAANHTIEEIKVIGLRRRIGEKMSEAKAHIPHITYVEEIDMTALEVLRASLNETSVLVDRTKLTLLPFIMLAMAKAIAEQPGLNAHYDDKACIIRRFGGVHIGIATQTQNGLMVPVVRHVEARDIWNCAAEIARISQAARSGTALREELTGSTITLTSLGAMGGIVSTPIINYPEVAIVGVNKMMIRPQWDGQQFIPRKMMNLSSSFDHRIIDGWDAATFIQRVKTLLETPAIIFMET